MSALDVVSDGGPVRLEDIVDRDALEEMCGSVQSMFGIGVRVYSSEGALLANAGSELELCRLVNDVAAGRVACGATVSAAKSVDPGDDGDVVHPCFTGLAYRIVSLEYETRRVGRVVIGPYVPAGLRELPPSLSLAVPKLDLVRSQAWLSEAPRVKPEAVGRIAHHLKTTLELILFTSHKAYVTSKLHLFSVRESYRALEEKTQRLEQALARLKELDRLKSNFLGTVSHELRTPLTSILGYSEMLAEGIAGPLHGEQVEFVRTIHEKGGQLLGLILGLLDLSKLESGTMSLKPASMPLAPTLEEALSTVAPIALKKGVALVLEAATNPACHVSGDAERLRQVFVNLVDNAVKFTPKGGSVTVRAHVIEQEPAENADLSEGDAEGSLLLEPVLRAHAEARTRVVEVTVSDTGIGLPQAERAKVFDAFYQVDSSSTREYGGTGLGLSIVKRIVEAHGGTVAIRDNTPSGTTFVVVLPSAPQATQTDTNAPPPPFSSLSPASPRG